MGRNAAPEKAGTPVTKEADLYSWAVRQAELLRAGRLSDIDPAAIAEEIDDVGAEEYHRLERALRALMLHLLKWDHQPDRRRSWTLSILEQRRRAQRQLRRSPGLKSQLDDALTAAYEDARVEAANETGLPLRAFPATPPFDYAEIMERPIIWPGDEAYRAEGGLDEFPAPKIRYEALALCGLRMHSRARRRHHFHPQQGENRGNSRDFAQPCGKNAFISNLFRKRSSCAATAK